MGRPRPETGIPEFGDRSPVLMKNFYLFVYCALSALCAWALAGPTTDRAAVNRTLKLCNEKPLECKFKYDIINYQETGKVPYTAPTSTTQKQKEK